MKNLYAGFFAIFIFNSLLVSAQEPVPVKQQIADKPFLFSQFSDKTECNIDDLQKIISSKISDNVSFRLGETFFVGEVVAKVQANSEVLNVNIRASNFQGALLTISFKKESASGQKIMGRMVHPQHGDVLVLVQEKNRFYFQKQQQKFIMTE